MEPSSTPSVEGSQDWNLQERTQKLDCLQCSSVSGLSSEALAGSASATKTSTTLLSGSFYFYT